jgi:alkylation response protein AidB-like acyl-CoA dehydrogenase
MIDFSLTDEQKDLQQRARKFAESEIAPVALQFDKEPDFPTDIMQKAHKAGFMNLTTPEEYGGRGFGLLDAALVTEELNATCTGIAGMIGINSLACGPILVGGTDEQKRRFLIPLCESGKSASFCLTERQAGSDAGGVKTNARREGDQYIINGQKCFITNGTYASFYSVFATLDPEKGTRGISAFIVPRETKGLSTGKIEDKMGQRALNVAEVNLDDVAVPVENRLGAEGEGFKIAMKTLDEGRINIAITSVGIARAALEAAVQYAKERRQFGKPIGSFQAVNFMLADMAAAVDAARLLTWYAASKADQELPHTREAAQAKFFAADVAMRVTTDAGYIKDYPVEKFMRDAKLTQIYEGTNQINRMVAGGALMR